MKTLSTGIGVRPDDREDPWEPAIRAGRAATPSGAGWTGLLGAAAVVLAAALCTPLEATAQEVPEWLERARIHGLAFGDYYWAASHHRDDEAVGEAEAVQGANGFWIRRVYLTFDYELDDAFDFRLRFEGNSPGDFQDPGKIEPHVKDLWIRWTGDGHQVYGGITGTPTWGFIEDFWGYRDVEKTPLDLHDFGSSRDFGVGATGRLDREGRVRYHVMVGNGAGTGAEVNEGKKVYGSLRYQHPDGYTVELYGDYEGNPGNADVGTYQAFVGWHGELARVGLVAARQHREQPGSENLDLELGSVFAVVDVHEKVNVLGRVDRLFDPNPGAADIDYFVMSPRAESTFFLAGVDVEIAERLHLIPNVEAVIYDDAAAPPNPDSDVFLRTTFSATF